ncbi:MAG: hypothetical protein ABIQ16_25740 [Polyangiaceae bacterium]
MSSGFENEGGRPAQPPGRAGPLVAALFGVLALGVAASACGPSVQSIYEGNVRFEHCYRLDLEVDTAPTHREACWKEWLGVYTYGQPLDRIEYARRRAQAFANGDVNRPSLDVDDANAKKSEARQFYLVVPTPTSAHAPPPPIATRWYADAGAPPTSAAGAEPADAPGEQCAAGCRGKHTECEEACGSDAGKPEVSCKGCDPAYKGCMRRCFE